MREPYDEVVEVRFKVTVRRKGRWKRYTMVRELREQIAAMISRLGEQSEFRSADVFRVEILK